MRQLSLEEFHALPEYQELGPAGRALADRWYAMTPEEREAFAERANQEIQALWEAIEEVFGTLARALSETVTQLWETLRPVMETYGIYPPPSTGSRLALLRQTARYGVPYLDRRWR